MSGDGSIGPVGQVAQPLPASGLTAGNAAPEVQNSANGAGLFPPNPSVHLDLALNLVVLEFRDNAGNVTSSIPSARQLQAYRLDGVPAAIGSPGAAPARATLEDGGHGPGVSRLG